MKLKAEARLFVIAVLADRGGALCAAGLAGSFVAAVGEAEIHFLRFIVGLAACRRRLLGFQSAILAGRPAGLPAAQERRFPAGAARCPAPDGDRTRGCLWSVALALAAAGCLDLGALVCDSRADRYSPRWPPGCAGLPRWRSDALPVGRSRTLARNRVHGFRPGRSPATASVSHTKPGTPGRHGHRDHARGGSRDPIWRGGKADRCGLRCGPRSDRYRFPERLPGSGRLAGAGVDPWRAFGRYPCRIWHRPSAARSARARRLRGPGTIV